MTKHLTLLDIVLTALSLFLNVGGAAFGWVTPQWALTMLLIHGATSTITVYRRERAVDVER